MPNVDSLSIEITASATSADKALDKLVGTIGKISASLGGVNFNGFAQGVRNISSAMQGLQNIKMPDYTKLANGISKIGSINSAQIQQAGVAIKELSGSLKYLDNINVSDNSKQIAELASGIAKLGYKSSTQAIANIPQLASAMRELMATLSTAPRVSQNLIDMTNALANLSRTGASSGRAATSLGKSLDVYTASTSRASKGTWNLASALGKLYASYWIILRAFGKIKEAIDISSSLTEVQNVVDVTFGDMAYKVEDFAQTSIQQFGMSELTLKEVASQFQAMGSAMNISGESIANANKYLNKQTNGYIGLSNSMADVSLNLTKLTADMASFYNVEQDVVAEDLQSIFTGQTKPLRQYGVDLTEVNLKQWAMTQGLNANIDSMTQAEKALLRYEYTLAHTGAAQGDFARTANTWANQVRILKQNFQQLASIIGGTFINALKPLVQWLNNAMSGIIAFAKTISNALGKIFGWKFEETSGGVASDLEYGEDAAGGIADEMGTAADNAKKMKSYLLGIDELNIIEPQEDTTTGGGAGGTGDNGGTGGGAGGGEWVKQDSILKEFESEIDNLYELGEYIRDALIGMMESIDWESVYEKARAFGKGLAEFLNGLLAYDKEGRTLFGEIGKTLANTLNAIVYAALEFAKEFDFYQLGVNLADGINQFFRNFDFKSLAESLNEWVDGFKETIRGFLDKISWKDIIGGITDFLGTLELDTVEVLIGAFALKNTAKNLKEMLFNAISTKFAFVTNPVNIPNLIISFAKLSITSPGMTGEIGIAISNLLKGSFLDPREWDNWIGELIVKINNAVNNFIDNFIGPAILSLGDAIATIILDVFNWDATLSLFDSAKENFKKGGLYIIQGVAEGILGAVGIIAEPIGDFFVGLWNAFCDTFGIHSPAEEMKPLGEFIFLGIVEGFRGKFEDFTTAINDFWDSYIIPWFTFEKWYGLLTGMSEAFLIKIQEIIVLFNENLIMPILTAFSTLWENIKTVWGAVANWFNENLIIPLSTFFNDFKIKVSETFSNLWNEIVNIWDSVSQWFNVHVIEPVKKAFETATTAIKGFFDKLWTGIKNGVVSAMNAVIGAIESAINFIVDGINSIISGFNKVVSWAAKVAETDFGGVDLVARVSIPRISGYFNGGFPESASLFWAGENGVTELLGTVGGKNAVASGAEITGIREAVYETGQAEVEEIRQQNELLNNILSAILEKELSIGDREIVESYERGRSRMGYAF